MCNCVLVHVRVRLYCVCESTECVHVYGAVRVCVYVWLCCVHVCIDVLHVSVCVCVYAGAGSVTACVNACGCTA